VKRFIDERQVHRLEAFSDIVIALSLSEIAFNLHTPLQTAELFQRPIYLVGFLVGFTFVASVWWWHSRIFAQYFVPDVFSLVANFVLLAALVLFAWAQQLFYKSGLDATTTVFYAVTGGIVYALLGLLFVRGARDAQLPLTGQERSYGFNRGARMFIVGGILLLSLAIAPFGAERIVDTWLLIVPAIIIARVMERRASRGLE